MHTGRKILAAFNILAVLSILGNALVFAVDQVAGQLIYDYVADPAVIIAIFLTVLVNLGDSLRKREGSGNNPEQLPRDVITALVAILGFATSCSTLIRWRPLWNPYLSCGTTSSPLQWWF